MPNTTSSPQTVKPSIQGGTAVSEFLRRINLRDPNRKPGGIYGRRMSDYESHSPKLETVAIFVLAAFIVGSFSSIALQKLANTRIDWPVPHSIQYAPPTPELLKAPKTPQPVPQSLRRPPAEAMAKPLWRPENVHVRFMGPRMIEIQWDSFGEGYAYQVFSAADPTMQEASPIAEQSVWAPHTVWTPDDNFRNVWLAVKGMDSKGRITAFTQPLLLQLPS